MLRRFLLFAGLLTMAMFIFGACSGGDPKEACCMGDGTCSDITVDACATAGGTAQGADSTCATSSCPQLEACCLIDGSCEDVLATECQGTNNPGLVCSEVTCPPAPSIITGSWQPTGGVYYPIICNRPPELAPSLIRTNPMAIVTDPVDYTNAVTLEDGCTVTFSPVVDGSASLVDEVVCEITYMEMPATQTVTSGSLTLSDTYEGEGIISAGFTIVQDIPAGPWGAAVPGSSCMMMPMFIQHTKDTGSAPLTVLATFPVDTFIESVERLGSDTWVMAFDHGGAGISSGVYKIPDGTDPLTTGILVSNYLPGFAGNIVFDDTTLYGTYSDMGTPGLSGGTRQVVEIDTTSGTRTMITDLTSTLDAGDPDEYEISPNGITLDTAGNMYIADGLRSRVYRLPAGWTPGLSEVEEWASGPDLDSESPGAPGVNGLKVFEGDLYVSVSGGIKLLRIPILSDGSAGTPIEMYMGVIGDDFALDVDGNVWMTSHPMNGIVLMRPDGTSRLMYDYLDELWGPTSAVFGTDLGDTTTLYTVNDGNIFGAVWPSWMNQSPDLFEATVQKVDVGVEGAAVPGVGYTP